MKNDESIDDFAMELTTIATDILFVRQQSERNLCS